jgi:hypothetical protein
VYYVWRRAGESRTVTIRAVMTATIGVVGWMAIAARNCGDAALREWDRDPVMFQFSANHSTITPPVHRS